MPSTRSGTRRRRACDDSTAATEANPAASALQALDHDHLDDDDEDHGEQRARGCLDDAVCLPKCHSCCRVQLCSDTSSRRQSACKSCGSDTGVWCPQCLQDRCGLEWSEYMRTCFSWECDHCRARKSPAGGGVLPVFCLAPRCLKEDAGLAPNCLSSSVAKAKGFDSTAQLFRHTIQRLYGYYSRYLEAANSGQTAGGAVGPSEDFKSWIKRQSRAPGRAVNIFDLVHRHQMAELENQDGPPAADIEEPEGRVGDASDQSSPCLIVDEPASYDCVEDEPQNGHRKMARQGEEMREQQANKRQRKKTGERPWRIQRKRRKRRARTAKGKGGDGGQSSSSSESDIENFIAREDSISSLSSDDDRPSRRPLQPRGLQQQKIQRPDQRYDTVLGQVHATLSSLSDSAECSCLCQMLESAGRKFSSKSSSANIGTVKVGAGMAVGSICLLISRRALLKPWGFFFFLSLCCRCTTDQLWTMWSSTFGCCRRMCPMCCETLKRLRSHLFISSLTFLPYRSVIFCFAAFACVCVCVCIQKKARATYHLLCEITAFCQSAVSTLLQTKSVDDMENVFNQCKLLFTVCGTL